MITKDNKSYLNGLYVKANTLIKEHHPEEEIRKSIEDNPISSIDEYFLHLGHIKVALEADQSVDDISYFMLPIEEPLFKINANTRNIEIPSEFSKGISVQGDEVAETIFFSIDRYYDTTDFYADEIVPIIQWKHADSKDKQQYNLSATTSKIVMEEHYDDGSSAVKVVFGWPISSEVTADSGNIQFSVRFCTIYDEDGNLITDWSTYKEGTLEYSFSTLNALVKIYPSLNIRMDGNSAQYSNKTQLLWKRMRNSKPSQLEFQAIAPIIEHFEPSNGVADLNEDGYLDLEVKVTYPSGTIGTRLGKELYEIIRTNSRGETEVIASGIIPENSNNIVSDNPKFGIKYFPSKDKVKNTTDVYYIQDKDGDGIFTGVYTEYDGNFISGLYECAQTYKVDMAGKYHVRITNILSDTNKASAETDTFEIALPIAPTVGIISDDYNEIIRENENLILELTVIDNDNGKGVITYQWLYSANENSTPETIEGATNLTLENVSKEGYHYLKATNSKNKDTDYGVNERPIRVTLPATPPNEFIYKTGPVNEETYAVPFNPDEQLLKQGFMFIRPSALRGEDFRYKWYKTGDNEKTIYSTANYCGIPESDIGTGAKFYCKVASIYNGDESEYVPSKEFMIG